MPTKLWPFCALLLLPLSAQSAGKGKPVEPNPYKLQLQNASDYHLQSGRYDDAAVATVIPAELAAKPYAREIEAAAKASRVDPVLVHALIHVESGYRKDAVSRRGAVGLMQVLPETAARFGVSNPGQVKNNLKVGTRYLRQLIDQFDGRLDLALAAYNAGEGVVQRYRDIPPYAETQEYVPAVLGAYADWRGQVKTYMPSSSAGMRMMR